MSIQVDAIEKSFGHFKALDRVSLEVPSGQLVGLLGPSGSGKTTLLRIIAGLEQADRGTILFNGQDMTQVPARNRRVGFVFQHYALFRHMTVFDNVAFGLSVMPRKERPGKDAIRERVMSLLSMVQLEHLAHRYPAQLSGGQRQRIALARALAVKPDVLLLDEPFGALDAKVRKDLRRWLRRLQDEVKVTSVFVTHDQDEAMEVSDQVVVMSQGRIEQVGSPRTVYERPATGFVYDFLGHVNRLQGQVSNNRWSRGDAYCELPVTEQGGEEALTLYLRPHELRLSTKPVAGVHMPVRVEQCNTFGGLVRLELSAEWAEDYLEAEISPAQFEQLQAQRHDQLYLLPQRLHVLQGGKPAGVIELPAA